MDERVHLKLDSSAAANVDEYFEYHKIVGDDDGGKPFTAAQYKAYKKRVFPMRFRNRPYVSWTNTKGMDCKLIGPETQCFCEHRYKQHKTDFAEFPRSNSELKCEVRGCRCSGYSYIPKNGSQPLRCKTCKHVATEHNVNKPHKCTRACKCVAFMTSYRCVCGDTCETHVTLVESREQRVARGHPVSTVEPPYKAMGGVTGMSSMIDGYMRLDGSGIGAPSDEWFQRNQDAKLFASEPPSSRQLTAGVRGLALKKK